MDNTQKFIDKITNFCPLFFHQKIKFEICCLKNWFPFLLKIINKFLKKQKLDIFIDKSDSKNKKALSDRVFRLKTYLT